MYQEEPKIKEAEIIVPEETEQEKHKGIFSEKILFFILAILIGMAVKTEAVKKITIGFDDYLMKFERRDFDLNRMQDEQIQKMIKEQELQNNEVENQN